MKRSVFLLIAVITAFLLSGCRFVRIEEEERKPVAYTVVEKSDIPEELSRIMEEKKEKGNYEKKQGRKRKPKGNKNTTANSGFLQWRVWGFFGMVSECISSLKEVFS